MRLLGRTLTGWRELPECSRAGLAGGESLTTPKGRGVWGEIGYESSKYWVALDLMQRDRKMWFTTFNTFVLIFAPGAAKKL